MLQKKIILFLSLLFVSSVFCMEQSNEETEESLLLIMLPAEIYLNILEFVLGVDPTFVQAKDIFEALDNAKKYVLENGNNFALACKFFNSFKGEFPRIAKQNLRNYLTLNLAQEYLGKSAEELNKLLETTFESCVTKENEIKAAKLICAGACPETIVKYKEWTDQYPLPPFKCKGYLLRFIILTYQKTDTTKLLPFLFLYNANINIKNIGGDTGLIMASKRDYCYLVEKLLKRKDIKINEANKEGYTALDYAQAREFKTIIAMLLAAHATENPDKVQKLKWAERPSCFNPIVGNG